MPNVFFRWAYMRLQAHYSDKRSLIYSTLGTVDSVGNVDLQQGNTKRIILDLGEF